LTTNKNFNTIKKLLTNQNISMSNIITIVDAKPEGSAENIKTFDELLQTPGIYLIDFWATWCGPCIMMEKPYEEMSVNPELSSKISFAKCDVDQNPGIVTREEFKITSIPTFHLIKVKEDKTFEKIEKFVGAQNPEQFSKSLLEKVLL
jgi:thiol-disulfide isomerase/thioredoxin